MAAAERLVRDLRIGRLIPVDQRKPTDIHRQRDRAQQHDERQLERQRKKSEPGFRGLARSNRGRKSFLHALRSAYRRIRGDAIARG